MRVGYSVLEITPPLGVELGGYGYFLGRKAKRVLDPLYARAVLFQDAGKSLLLVCCDLIGLKPSLVHGVRKRISDACGIRQSNIMIHCIHTHTGPATGGTPGCGEEDGEYMSLLSGLLIDAGKKAFENIRTVIRVKQFVKPVEPISFNRVDRSAPIDSDVRGAAFFFEEGRPLALVSYGCHPVTLGPAPDISADYPGRALKALSDKGFDGIFLNGFCGDTDPVSNKTKWGAGTEEVIDENGGRIAEAFMHGIGGAGIMTDLTLDVLEIPVKLRLQSYGPDEIEKELELYGRRKEENPGIYKVVAIWAGKMKRHLQEEPDPCSEVLTIQVFRIGEVILAGFPGEVFTRLGMTVKKAVPERNVITIGSVNDSMRYIATRADIENRGYAGFESSFLFGRLPLMPGEGERLAEIVAEILKTVVPKDKIV